MIDPFDTAASLYTTPVIKMSTACTIHVARTFVRAVRVVIGATDLTMRPFVACDVLNLICRYFLRNIYIPILGGEANYWIVSCYSQPGSFKHYLSIFLHGYFIMI